MTVELRNYLRRLTEPFFAVTAIVNLCKAIVRKIWRILFPVTRSANMNEEIKAHRAEIINAKTFPLCIREPGLDKSYTLKLAIGGMELRSTADWHNRFMDAEMNVSIDRWGWLLTGTAGEALPFNSKEGLLLMRSWASQFISDLELAKDAYSTGERIVNGVIFLKLHQAAVPPDVKMIFTTMARQVARHIEYFSSELTGNHAFNNARALYFAGYVTSTPVFTAMAIAVAKERLPALITEDGFMREGSSHYHFLFTRWVLEMIWCARIQDDNEALALFTSFAEKLIKRCWFFLVQNQEDQAWNIPLFGDVSPDCSPQWLMALPWSKLANSIYSPTFLPKPPDAEGWAELFGGLERHTSTGRKYALSFSSACGWHRMEGYEWTFFTRAPNINGVPEATHSHLDLCSFVLFYNGKPLLADVGRLDYTNSPLSHYGKSAYSHNAIILNGLGTSVDIAGWMLPSYASVNTSVHVMEYPDNISITVIHDGFNRIARSKIDHQRKITLSSCCVEIIDSINGKGNCKAQVFFHFAPGIVVDELSANQLHISSHRTDFILNTEVRSVSGHENYSNKYTGWMFPAYGIKVPILSFETCNEGNLPIQLRNRIILNR